MSEYIQKPKSFKKLVQDITYICSEDERNRVFWEIDWSFQRDVIKWQEHEMLFDLASRIRV